jgi:NAD dependent epimerase/dehydratase
MKKILITGASGFIGSHLTEKLVNLGHTVRVIVPYNVENSWGWLDYLDAKIKKNLEVISGDICDQDLINKSVKDVDVVFHLAALISIPYSYISPRSYVSVNITGTLNLLEAARTHSVELIVNTSTSEVYGSSQYSPIDELHPLNAQSPYAASKIAADQLCLSYNKSFNLPVTIIRPFNTFGPRQSLRAAIPTMITQVIINKKEINLGNLISKRDFSYVDDTVMGFVSCLSNKKCIGEVINLGSGYDFSMQEVLLIIEDILNKKLKVNVDQNRIRPEKSEVNHLLSNNTKAKKLLNWEPQFKGKKGFQEGIRKTIEWFGKKENLSLYKSNIYNV